MMNRMIEDLPMEVVENSWPIRVDLNFLSVDLIHTMRLLHFGLSLEVEAVGELKLLTGGTVLVAFHRSAERPSWLQSDLLVR